MCSIGLEGWKIVSRFNYILFRFFFHPREALSSLHTHSLFLPPSSLERFFFMFFLLFQFPLEWKSLEHYCNFFFKPKHLPILPSTSACIPIHIYTKWMDFCLLFLLCREMNTEIVVVVKEFMGNEASCVWGGLCAWRRRVLWKNRQ